MRCIVLLFMDQIRVKMNHDTLKNLITTRIKKMTCGISRIMELYGKV